MHALPNRHKRLESNVPILYPRFYKVRSPTCRDGILRLKRAVLLSYLIGRVFLNYPSTCTYSHVLNVLNLSIQSACTLKGKRVAIQDDSRWNPFLRGSFKLEAI